MNRGLLDQASPIQNPKSKIQNWIITVCLLGVMVVALYLVAPLLTRPKQVSYVDAVSELNELMPLAPADASHVVLMPHTASTYWAVRRHAVIGSALRELEETESLRALPWLLGNSGVVIWTRRGEVGAVSSPDPLRHFLARIAGVPLGVHVRGPLVAIGRTQGGFLPPLDVPSLLGQFFVIHNRREDGGFPPMELPAISAIMIGEKIQLHTVARSTQRSTSLPIDEVRMPQSAMLAAAFSSSPRFLQRAEQAFPVDISGLLEGGGVVALYEIQNERFLPRPRGVLILPVDDRSFDRLQRRLEALSPELPFGISDESRRELMGQTVIRRESLGFALEYTRRGNELLVAFDRTSLERFLADTVRSMPIPAGQVEWFIRVDPRRLAPALDRLRNHAGLNALLPEVVESLDDFRNAIQRIEQSPEVLAMKRDNGQEVVLEVSISPPK